MRSVIAVGVCLLMSAQAIAQVREVRDVVYLQHDGQPLHLDLYLPAGPSGDLATGLIVWVHGGAWRSGSRKDVPIKALLDHGYAIASVDYRLSPVARFPAQAHDLHAAIRFLRAQAGEYGYRPDRIAIAGSSAGGHLAALVGVTADQKQLSGDLGEHTAQSSRVAAIIDLYGPTNFTTILQQSTVHGLGVRIPALQLLLGGQPEDKPDLARLASPVFHVDPGDPPLLIIHGDQDVQVPINQSHELHALYKQHNLPVHFEVIHGGAHGGKSFYNDAAINLMRRFLDEHVKP